MSPLSNNAVSTSIDSITDIVDALPIGAIADAGSSTLDTIVDVVAGAADSASDVAILAGAGGTRIAIRSVRAAWDHRRAVAIAAALVGVITALVVWRRSSQDGPDAVTSASS